MCVNCQKKEGAATTGNNLEVLSSGSHRDDVSQSTMAARSSKTLAEGNTSLKGGEMNATMTTIDGSDRGRYRQVLPPKMVSHKFWKQDHEPFYYLIHLMLYILVYRHRRKID